MGDGFGALRLVAASLVVFGHAYAMLGVAAPQWLGIEVHVFAVRIFFTISGYLVCGSWRRDPRLVAFLWRRALRILPALWVTVLVTVGVVGPLASSLGLPAYVVAPDTRLYLWNLVLAPYYLLPGVFQDGRPFTAVNGSLWSLPVEVVMYLLLPVYARRGLLVGAVVLALAGSFWFGTIRAEQVQPVVWWTSLPFVARFASDFVLGAAVACWRLERFLSPQVALVAVAGAALLGPYPWVLAAATLAVVPYAVLTLGLVPGVWARGRWLAGVDLSYGIYLWGGVVLQLGISVLGRGVAPPVLFAACWPVAAAAAAVSWHVVERTALRLKPR